MLILLLELLTLWVLLRLCVLKTVTTFYETNFFQFCFLGVLVSKATLVKIVRASTTPAARHPVRTVASARRSTTTTTNAHVQKVITVNNSKDSL